LFWFERFTSLFIAVVSKVDKTLLVFSTAHNKVAKMRAEGLLD